MQEEEYMVKFEDDLYAAMSELYPNISVRSFSIALGKSSGYWSSITSQDLPVSHTALIFLNDYLECKKCCSKVMPSNTKKSHLFSWWLPRRSSIALHLRMSRLMKSGRRCQRLCVKANRLHLMATALCRLWCPHIDWFDFPSEWWLTWCHCIVVKASSLTGKIFWN